MSATTRRWRADRRQLEMPVDAERAGDRARSFDLPRMPLPVAESVSALSVKPSDAARMRRGRCTESRPPLRRTTRLAVRDHASHASRPGDQMNLCSCICTRTGSRSAIIHSDSVLGSSTPWTGENRIAARARRQLVARDDVARELVVGAIEHDELHLVVRRQPFEVGPVVLVRFAASGTLHVDDLDDAARARDRSAGALRFRAAPSGRPRAADPSAGTRLPAAAARHP